MSTQNNAQPANSGDNTKLTLILIYVFWIVGLILHFQKKTAVTAFHLRQVLGLYIIDIVLCIVCTVLSIVLRMIAGPLAIIGTIAMLAVMLGTFYIWLMGLLSALKGEMKPLPFVGAKIESMLGKLFE